MHRLAAFAALVVLSIVAAGSAGATTSSPVVFTDPTGDSGTAPDLKQVSITNDDKGQYTFTADFATPYSDTAGFLLYLDSDLNAATGDQDADGAEYLLGDDHGSHSFFLEKWNGTAWEDAASDATVSVSVASDNLQVVSSINESDLGNSTGFNLFAVSLDGDGSDGHFDDAPSGSGTWKYTLQQTVKLSVAAAHATTPKAGGAWAIVAAATRSDTGKTLGSEGAIVCKAASGTTKLALITRAFISSGANGISAAVCGFKVPAKLKGKVVHATMTLSYQGQSVSRTFTARVK